jgi:hypothetical protein
MRSSTQHNDNKWQQHQQQQNSNYIRTLTYKLLLLQQHLRTGLQLSAQDCEKKP